jgi:hypothetical protein
MTLVKKPAAQNMAMAQGKKPPKSTQGSKGGFKMGLKVTQKM